MLRKLRLLATALIAMNGGWLLLIAPSTPAIAATCPRYNTCLIASQCIAHESDVCRAHIPPGCHFVSANCAGTCINNFYKGLYCYYG